MAQQTRDDSFTEEVEDRLENLFGDEEPSENAQKEAEEVADSPLRELKTIVLSIEWEITDVNDDLYDVLNLSEKNITLSHDRSTGRPRGLRRARRGASTRCPGLKAVRSTRSPSVQWNSKPKLSRV